jgi:hypothetical protein
MSVDTELKPLLRDKMSMHSDPYNRSTELMLWIILNLTAAGVSTFAIGGFGALEGETLLDQIVGTGGALMMMGGPLLITLLQWISIRRMNISQLGILWVVTGLVGSLLAFLVVGISGLGLGNYPTQTEYFYFAILAVSEHYVILGFVQGVLWWLRDRENIRRAMLWVILHGIGFILVAYLAYHLIYTLAFNLSLTIGGSLIMMAVVFSLSGMVLSHTRRQEIIAGSAK